MVYQFRLLRQIINPPYNAALFRQYASILRRIRNRPPRLHAAFRRRVSAFAFLLLKLEVRDKNHRRSRWIARDYFEFPQFSGSCGRGVAELQYGLCSRYGRDRHHARSFPCRGNSEMETFHSWPAFPIKIWLTRQRSVRGTAAHTPGFYRVTHSGMPGFTRFY